MLVIGKHYFYIKIIEQPSNGKLTCRNVCIINNLNMFMFNSESIIPSFYYSIKLPYCGLKATARLSGVFCLRPPSPNNKALIPNVNPLGLLSIHLFERNYSCESSSLKFIASQVSEAPFICRLRGIRSKPLEPCVRIVYLKSLTDYQPTVKQT